MSTSTIFSTAPTSSKEAIASAIFQTAPYELSESSTSAIFVTEDGISAFTVFGATSSAPFVELFAPDSTFGPISRDIFISPPQPQFFGPVNSAQYQTVADRGVGFRAQQFRYNTIDLDRFASPLGAVLDVYQDLDLTTATTTSIYTVPTGTSVIITGCLIRIKSADTVSVDADVSLGINPSTTNLFATETLVGVQAVHDFWSFWKQSSVGVLANAGEQVDLDVVTAATATTLTADVYIIGLLL